MRLSAAKLRFVGGFLVLGASLIMATSLIAGTGVYSFTLNSIDGKPAPLADYKGKVVLLVNVASQCGYTPQYSALESIYEKYKDQGFVILGFPANNFGAQEPGTNAEIKTFCKRKYSVSFPMYSKISVKGADQAPLYAYLPCWSAWSSSASFSQLFSRSTRWVWTRAFTTAGENGLWI